MSAESPTIYIMSVNVGEGNPTTAESANRILGNSYPVILTTINESARPADAWHKSMSTSAKASASYSENDKGLREKAAAVLGPLMYAEFRLKNLGIFAPRLWGKVPPRILVATQELPLYGESATNLQTTFNQGVGLLIPDVHPKHDTALKVIKQRKAIPIVWNKDAYEELKASGQTPLLTQPFLPIGYPDELNEADMKGILIKSSGSGMPPEHIDAFKRALEKLGIPFRFYLSDTKITDKGEEPRPEDKTRRILAFNFEAVSLRPRLIVSGPSEMTQVGAVFAQHGTVQLLSGPRGHHERRNIDWALKHKTASLLRDPLDSSKLVDDMKRAYEATPEVNGQLSDQLGHEELVSVVRRFIF